MSRKLTATEIIACWERSPSKEQLDLETRLDKLLLLSIEKAIDRVTVEYAISVLTDADD